LTVFRQTLSLPKIVRNCLQQNESSGFIFRFYVVLHASSLYKPSIFLLCIFIAIIYIFCASYRKSYVISVQTAPQSVWRLSNSNNKILTIWRYVVVAS